MSSLVPVGEHLERVLRVTPLLEAERVPLDEAMGRRLAEDVLSTAGVPPWDNSAMDGYALRHEDLAGGGPVTLAVVADVPAGSTADPRIGTGQAVRIMTGATLPSDADTVVRLEDTDRTDPLGALPITVTVPGSVSTGSGSVTATLGQTPAQAGDTTTAPTPAATATYTVAPLTSKTGTVGTITIGAGVGVAGRSQTITALVKNTAGSRLVGRAVVFSISGRNTVKPTTAKTNGSGVATLHYVPAKPGTEKVTVTSSPVTATATVSVAVQPRLTARSTVKHRVTLTIRTVPKIKHRNVFGYRIGAGGARVPIGLATTNAKGVATLLVVGLKSGKRYSFTVWLAYTSVPELYAKTVTVKVR